MYVSKENPPRVHTLLLTRKVAYRVRYAQFYVKISQKIGRIVLELREREHEDVDRKVHQDINDQQALKRCGLYKFWKLAGLRAQPRLLQMFVDYWDLDT